MYFREKLVLFNFWSGDVHRHLKLKVYSISAMLVIEWLCGFEIKFLFKFDIKKVFFC